MLVRPCNVFAGIELIEEGRVTVFNPVEYANIFAPKLVTELGIVMDVRPVI